MTLQLEAAILDWAGTTMDFGCVAPAVVFQQVFAEKGVPISMVEARGPMGVHKRVHIERIAKYPSVTQRWSAKHQREPTDVDIEEMYSAFVPKQLLVLPKYANLISGTLEAVEECRRMDLKIGSDSGYTGEMMELLLEEAAQRGYFPDVTVAATGHFARKNEPMQGPLLGPGQTNISRPKPAMASLNAYLLDISDNTAAVKVDDTIEGHLEGRAAGMWTVLLAATGNEMYFTEEDIGLTEEEIRSKDPVKYRATLERAYDTMSKVNPDYIIDGIRDLPSIVANINRRLKNGLRPGNMSTKKISSYIGSF